MAINQEFKGEDNTKVRVYESSPGVLTVLAEDLDDRSGTAAWLDFDKVRELRDALTTWLADLERE